METQLSVALISWVSFPGSEHYKSLAKDSVPAKAITHNLEFSRGVGGLHFGQVTHRDHVACSQ